VPIESFQVQEDEEILRKVCRFSNDYPVEFAEGQELEFQPTIPVSMIPDQLKATLIPSKRPSSSGIAQGKEKMQRVEFENEDEEEEEWDAGEE
jgi:hypothetical protein